jgi:hypothetical protein
MRIRILAVGIGIWATLSALAGGADAAQKAKHPEFKGTPTAEAGPEAGQPALEPKAIDILKEMSAKLAAAKAMSFTAVTTYESPSRLGPPLVYATTSEVTVQRPDKLKVITSGDGPASEFYYDGKTMTAYEPASNLVAIADAPPTIDAALRAAYETAAIFFPFDDVVVADPYADFAPQLKRAFYIGQSKVIGGTTTDMIAVVTDQLFGQLWVGADDHLPRAFRAIYLDDPSRLRQQVDFSNWKLDVALPEGTFGSAAASGAQRIKFARPDPQPPKEAIEKTKPSPAKRKGGSRG